MIVSNIDISSSIYKKNYEFNLNSVKSFNNILDTIKKGGDSKLDPRKLPVRKRIQTLIDKDSFFLELSSLASHNLYKEYTPSAGIITGVGLIHNKPCMIIANDPTVKGGSYFPITVKKHLRAQWIAQKNRLPCIYLVDSGGAYLPMQDEVFPDVDDFGRIFYNQSIMSSLGILQISSVHGLCTAGGAYIPAMSDQTIMVDRQGYIFLAGPPLVKAATGEEVSAEDLGGARIHSKYSGVCDYVVENDTEALLKIREILSHLNTREKADINFKVPLEPKYPIDEILGIIPEDKKKPWDIKEVLIRVVDDSYIQEYKPNYGTTLICGFSSIGGIPVGILANNGILFSDSSLKATHFIEICTKEKIPLVFFQNTSGFMVGSSYEKGGIAKDGAKMVQAVSNAKVPKITIIVGSSYGAGNYGMCGRAYDPDFLFIWPESKISVMGAEQAANVMYNIKKAQLLKKGIQMSEEEENRIKDPLIEKYQLESSAYYSSARLWDDGIIDPRDTRKYICMALSSCMYHKIDDTKFPIFRM